jgi:hypothetical protein
MTVNFSKRLGIAEKLEFYSEINVEEFLRVNYNKDLNWVVIARQQKIVLTHLIYVTGDAKINYNMCIQFGYDCDVIHTIIEKYQETINKERHHYTMQ